MPTGVYKDMYTKEEFDKSDYPLIYLRDGIKIHTNAEISDDEMKKLLKRGRDMWNYLTDIYVLMDEDEMEVGYITEQIAYERLRRVTGYISGTLDRFNDAKKAEVLERVKHQV